MHISKIHHKYILIILISFLGQVNSQTWKPVGNNVKTTWGEDLNPDKVLQEYPRPIIGRDEYINFAKDMVGLVKSGFLTAIYTQTRDVEGEVNGLMTYDRKKVKVDAEKISDFNQEVIDAKK